MHVAPGLERESVYVWFAIGLGDHPHALWLPKAIRFAEWALTIRLTSRAVKFRVAHYLWPHFPLSLSPPVSSPGELWHADGVPGSAGGH